MSVVARCGSCQKAYKVDDKHVGRKFRCKACGGVVSTTATGAPAPASRPPAAPISAAVSPMAAATATAIPAPLTPAPALVMSAATQPAVPLRPEYHAGPPDPYIHFDGEVWVDRIVPTVSFTAFVLALLAPVAIFAYQYAMVPAARSLSSQALWTLLFIYLEMLGIVLIGLFAIPTGLLFLGVFVSSRVMKFEMPRRAFVRCAAVVCAPVAIQSVLLGLGVSHGGFDAPPIVWWAVSFACWLTALWLMFRLRPAPFAVTVVFALLFGIVVPVLLALLLMVIAASSAVITAMAKRRATLSSSAPPPAPPPIIRTIPTTRNVIPAAPRPRTQSPPVTPTPPRTTRDSAALRAQAEATLKKLSAAVSGYAANHDGQLPPDLRTLWDAGQIQRTDFEGKITYHGKSQMHGPLPAAFVLASDILNAGDGKRTVLFGDGHIETIDMSQWSAVFRASMEAQREMRRAK